MRTPNQSEKYLSRYNAIACAISFFGAVILLLLSFKLIYIRLDLLLQDGK